MDSQKSIQIFRGLNTTVMKVLERANCKIESRTIIKCRYISYLEHVLRSENMNFYSRF